MREWTELGFFNQNNAIRYALGRMPKARPYLDNGQLELDNNICERSVRRNRQIDTSA